MNNFKKVFENLNEATANRSYVPKAHLYVELHPQTGDLNIVQRKDAVIELSSQEDVNLLIKALTLFKKQLPK